MNYDGSRRPSATPFAAQDAIPVAPPLPASRPLQRARDAATRFFGYQSRSASPQRSLEEDRSSSLGRSRYASLSATQNATASHRTGLEINTLAINESGTHVVLGGKEIFRTVKVEDGTFAIGFDLRSAIRSTPTHASGKARQAYSVDIADVAWAKGDCGNYVAAATSSGKIVLYDLGHAGIQAAQLHEHFRQVHKVTFNPHRGCLLLSGSQDGTVRLWDVRDVRQASTLQSKRKYSGQSDGVRDVKWSPTDGVDFAFGTDSGWIQRWDMRNLKTAKVKIPAHSETCNAIDWHPDGKHIASASSDKTVRVWDFSATRKQQKASWEIKTPFRVSNARWRPSCESSMFGDLGTRQCTQLITTYDHEHEAVHVWDFRRPALPFRELFPFSSAPTDMLWHSQDLVWLVGREGTFLQADIQHAPKVINKRNMQAFTPSSLGDICFVTQKRPRARPSLPPQQRASITMDSKSGSASESPQRDGMLSRSWADDGLDQSFLQAKRAKPATPQSTAMIRAPSVSTSSSSGDIFFTRTVNLDQVLSSQGAVRPRQDAYYARLPYALDPKLFAFMASNYKIDLSSLPDDENFLKGFEALFEHNSKVAYAVGLYRTSQTWKILCFAMKCHLERRAEMNTKRALEHKPSIRTPSGQATLVEIMQKLVRDAEKSFLSSPLSFKPVSAITQQLTLSDINSEQPTPLAKPATVAKTLMLSPDSGLPDLDKEATLTLPPSVSPPPPTSSIPQVEAESKLTSSNLSGLQKIQQNTVEADKRAMVRRWSIQPKEPLSLDPVDVHGVKIPSPKLQRQNSNESFMFLDSSAASRDPSYHSSYDDRVAGRLMASERPGGSSEGNGGEGDSGEIASRDFDDRPAASPMIHVSDVTNVGDVALSGRPRSPSWLSDQMAGDKEDMPTATRDGHDYISTGTQVRENASPAPVPAISGTVLMKENKTGHGKCKVESAATDKTEQEKEPALYLPQDNDEDLEEDKPFEMVDMLRQLVRHYVGKGDAQTAAHMILALAPFLPRTHPLPEVETTQTVAAYMESLTSAGFTRPEIESILTKHLEPLVKSGLQPLHIEAILCTYHDQLIKRQLWNEAALLRRLSYPMYPSVYEDAMADNHVSLRCGHCKKPIKSGMAKMLCESCGLKQAKCSLCESDTSPFEGGKGSKMMTGCLKCGHVLHAACWAEWVKEDEGGCPTVGCLCDCIEGGGKKEEETKDEMGKGKGKGRVDG